MKHHFSPRSLLFYGCAISSVTILFALTTAYGERNLQAPRRIDGRYPLALASQPNCFQGKAPILILQQSGIFLTGSLIPTDAPEQTVRIAQERPALSGQWRADQLALAGTLGRAWTCVTEVSIDARLTQETLNGMLRLSVEPAPIAITSDRQLPPAQPADPHSP